MNIGQKIKELAELKNVSVKELGDKVGRTRQAIYDIYSGKVSVNIDLLEKVCGVLDVKMYTLFIDERSLPQSKEDLKKVVIKATDEVIKGNYISVMHIKQLIVNINDKAKEGQGLINLEISHGGPNTNYPFIENYKPLNKPISKAELQKYTEKIYTNFFRKLLMMMNVQDYDTEVSDFIDKNFE